MPASIPRFLRLYASIVVMLVAGVIAFGVEPVEGADFANVVSLTTVASVERDATRVSTRASSLLRTMVVDARATDAFVMHRFAADGIPVRTLALSRASARASEDAARLCGNAILKVRRPI